MNTHVTAIILAAGSGTRMNMNVTKQKLIIGNETVLHRSVRVFNSCGDIDSIIVVARADEIDFVKAEVSEFDKVIGVTVGGKSRVESAMRGFELVGDKTDFVAIHDSARCFISVEMISKVISDAKIYGAATASAKITDTVKEVNEESDILKTIPRDRLVSVQTPQIFQRELYEKAIRGVDLYDSTVTDDNSLLERIGVFPHCTETGKNNIKITTQDDIAFANFLLERCENV